MRKLSTAAAVGAALIGGTASAADVEIRNAAVRVVVVPEARQDVRVVVAHPNPKLPIRVFTGFDGRVIVDGGLTMFLVGRPITCGPNSADGWMNVWGVGRFTYDELPQVIIRVPLDAHVAAGGGVFGAVGPAQSLDLASSGCGGWDVAEVQDALRVRSSGASQVRTGGAGRMSLRASGSGHIVTHAARQGLDADVSGSGGIHVSEASGDVRANVSGGGQIAVDAGHAASLKANASGSGSIAYTGSTIDFDGDISGSGRITVRAVTDKLRASISGGGDMDIKQAAGAVDAHLSGSGRLQIEGGHVAKLDADVSGSGGVDFTGVADQLDAQTSGAGNIRVAKVTGSINSHSSGAGRVVVGP